MHRYLVQLTYNRQVLFAKIAILKKHKRGKQVEYQPYRDLDWEPILPSPRVDG